MATKHSSAGLVNRATRVTSGAITVTIDDNNITTNGVSTVSLPVASEYYTGFIFTITSTTTDSVTVNADWTDVINGSASYTISSPGQTFFRITEQGKWSAAFTSESSIAENLYTADGALTWDRAVDGAGFQLGVANASEITLEANDTISVEAVNDVDLIANNSVGLNGADISLFASTQFSVISPGPGVITATPLRIQPNGTQGTVWDILVSTDVNGAVEFASPSSIVWNDLYKVNNLLVSDINLVATTAMDWDVSTEITTNASLYTLVASWIEVSEDGIYKVAWSIYYEWGTNTQRKSVILKHTINGVAQSETFQSYIRMTQGANEISTATLGVYSLSSGDTINITGERGAGNGVCQAIAWNSVLVIEKIG